MMKNFLSLAALAVFTSCASAPVMSQENNSCFPRDVAFEMMLQKHGEIPMFSGLRNDGLVMTLTVNPNGTTWSVLIDTGTELCYADFGPQWLVPPAPLTEPKGQEG